MSVRRWWIIAILVLLAPLAQAATPPSSSGQGVHAFLDRSHVSLGDTVTLNLESKGSIGNPDLAPLQKDFEVLGSSRSSSTQIVNGKVNSNTQLGIALKPRHAGTLTIPALSVGGSMTAPLTLHVGVAAAGGRGKVGDPVFMQASVLSSSPYVGQQTVYTVRLFYQPGVDGSLDDPSADGARLIQLDRDHRYLTDRDGYTYKVVERSWALIPERSGAITIDGPTFHGRNLAPGAMRPLLTIPNSPLNNPNLLLNGPFPGLGAAVHAAAPDVTIKARAEPAAAGKPWLPARAVQLKLTGLPADGKLDAGSPLTLTLDISAAGQPADALPEPELPPIPGARVYPDQTRDATDDSGEWLQGSRTRSFAIVPDRDGQLTIPAITLDWWDVTRDRAEQASLPAHVLTVSGVVANAPTPAAPPTPAGTAAAATTPAVVSSNRPAPTGYIARTPWKVIALAGIVTWLIAIVAAIAWWAVWMRRRAKNPATGDRGGPDTPPEERERKASDGVAVPPTPADSAKPESARILQRQALDAARAGDAAACEHALLAWAHATRPAITNTGLLLGALSDPAQREALVTLQRARWQGQGEDAARACVAIGAAFAHGLAWRDAGQSARSDGDKALPPLYPPP